jgi:hypothetical protein
MLKININGDVKNLESETEYSRIERKIGEETCIIVPSDNEIYILDTNDSVSWIVLAVGNAPFYKEISVYENTEYLIDDLVNRGIISDDIIVTDLDNVDIEVNVNL